MENPKSASSSPPEPRQPFQFQIRHLIFLTFVCAICASVFAWRGDMQTRVAEVYMLFGIMLIVWGYLKNRIELVIYGGILLIILLVVVIGYNRDLPDPDLSDMY